MGKKKSSTTNTMTYSQITPQDTPDTIAARNAAQQANQADPRLQYLFGRRKQDIDNSLNSFGSEISPETREAMRYSRQNELSNDFGAAMQADAHQRSNANFQRLYGLAGLTAPRIVQTGGTSNSVQSQPIWPGLIAGGLQAGLGAI